MRALSVRGRSRHAIEQEQRQVRPTTDGSVEAGSESEGGDEDLLDIADVRRLLREIRLRDTLRGRRQR